MTLELTPEQITALKYALSVTLSDRSTAKTKLWDAPKAYLETIDQKIQEIASLHDLLEKSTAVILYQP